MGNSWVIASSPIRIVRLDGQVQEFHKRTFAADLLLGNPNFLLCHTADLRLGLRPRALHTDSILRFGQVYFLLPVRFFQSPLTVARLVSLYQKASVSVQLSASPSKKKYHSTTPQVQPFVGGKPKPLFLVRKGQILQIGLRPEILEKLVEEGVLPRSPKVPTVPNINVCHTPDMQAKYLKHLIARSRSWRPRIETIEEAAASEIYDRSHSGELMRSRTAITMDEAAAPLRMAVSL